VTTFVDDDTRKQNCHHRWYRVVFEYFSPDATHGHFCYTSKIPQFMGYWSINATVIGHIKVSFWIGPAGFRWKPYVWAELGRLPVCLTFEHDKATFAVCIKFGARQRYHYFHVLLSNPHGQRGVPQKLFFGFSLFPYWNFVKVYILRMFIFVSFSLSLFLHLC
jgi:hypothetical protein